MAETLPITGLHHIARVTRRPVESIAFYRDVLGFEEIQRPGFNFRGAWLFNYGVQIHIIENPSSAPDPERPIDSRGDHLAFHVTDIELAKAKLRGSRTEFTEQVNAGGIHQVFFRDPDGHFIELATYGPTPPPVKSSVSR
jgi:catechol 2,3-dioxygenase-like lactoylglutathione lyase family enzyme